MGVTREELAAWFGNGTHSLGINQFEVNMVKGIPLDSSYDEAFQRRRTLGLRSGMNLTQNFRVTEKDLCSLFFRLDSDFDGEVDFWEMEKILLVRNEFQGGSIPIKRVG